MFSEEDLKHTVLWTHGRLIDLERKNYIVIPSEYHVLTDVGAKLYKELIGSGYIPIEWMVKEVLAEMGIPVKHREDFYKLLIGSGLTR